MEALKRFFDKIDFPLNEDFEDVKVEKVKVNNKKNTWDVHLSKENVLPLISILNLIEASKKEIKDISKIKITMLYENITEEDIVTYTKYYVDLLTEKYPSLISMIDNEIKLEDNKIILEVLSKIEEKTIKENSKKMSK